jgi:hypothetical protein
MALVQRARNFGSGLTVTRVIACTECKFRLSDQYAKTKVCLTHSQRVDKPRKQETGKAKGYARNKERVQTLTTALRTYLFRSSLKLPSITRPTAAGPRAAPVRRARGAPQTAAARRSLC